MQITATITILCVVQLNGNGNNGGEVGEVGEFLVNR